MSPKEGFTASSSLEVEVALIAVGREVRQLRNLRLPDAGKRQLARFGAAQDDIRRVRVPARVDAGARFVGRGLGQLALARQRQTGPLAGEHAVERVGDGVAPVGRQFGLHRLDIAGERGLDQHRAGDVVGIGGDVHETDGAGERMADIDQGNRQGGGLDEPAQIVGHVAEVRRAGRGVAEP